MKRASLKSVKVSVLSNPNSDVTDRLLKSHDPATSPSPPRAKSVESPKPPKPRRAGKSPPSGSQSQPAAPAAANPDGSLSHALHQTRLALEALNLARDSAEARYSLGVRYRLDALAHHLEQVAQFVTSQAI